MLFHFISLNSHEKCPGTYNFTLEELPEEIKEMLM